MKFESSRAIILNVEDYAYSREATSELLRNAGYSVIEAATGADALKFVGEARPHLVLLDVNLPDISGYEVCKQLKNDPATRLIPVLHISGSFVEGRDKVRGLEGGADGYLIKPVNGTELIATIRSLLRIREAEISVRESEERLRLALEAAEMGAWECNVETGEMTMDQRAHSLLGSSAVVAQLLTDIHPEDRERVDQAIRQAIEAKANTNLEFRTRTDGSAYRWLEASAQVKCDSGDQLTRLTGVVRDITDRKTIEEEREQLLGREREARGEAEAANRARDEFLAIVAHELRSPLNAVLGWAQILLNGKYTQETLTHAIEIIESSARSQQKLIEDLLDSARIVSGKLRLEIQPVDLVSVVETALETVRPAASAKGISLTTAYGGGSAGLTGDPERLQQIVWNLLSNAIKFTPEGGSVSVRLQRAQSKMELTICDTGKGIKRDFLPFVFDRFLQAEGSNTRRHGGLGLGLALVWHLAELHGGTVRVESPGEGLGTTFSVTLPLRGRPSAVAEPEPVSANPGLNLPTALEGLRILMVDDDRDARELVTVILEQHGAVVVPASSAKHALAILEDAANPRPDCLVSDIGMPDHNGYWLIGRVRALSAEEGGTIPAIAVTAFGRAADRIAALTAGFHRHLAKPVDPSELVMVIASLVNRAGVVRNL
ncbi:MAG: response regulator [Acidobacteriota bacterium]